MLDTERIGLDVQPVDADRAGGRLVVARQHADQGGLAGAVRAQQADDLTRADVKGDIAQGGEVLVVLADATDLDHPPPLISEREDPTIFQCAAFHDERRRSRSGGLRLGEASRSETIIPRASDPAAAP